MNLELLSGTTPRATLAIAGVIFEIESQPPLRTNSWAEVYAPFLQPAPREGALRVHVTIARGLLPPPPDAVHLFDGARAWSIWGAGDARHLVHAPQGLANPVWTAQLSTFESAAAVHVGCGESLVQPVADDSAVDCPLRYPLDQVLLMYLLARRRGLLIHAAGVILDGKLFILAGRSGAGKSTVSGLLTVAGLGTVLSDDRLVLREQAGRWMGHGTPWPGTARIARAGAGPIAGILFLEHGTGNRPERLNAAAALHAMLPLLSILWHERELVGPMTDVAADLLSAVPAYRFAFTPDVRAATALAAFMRA